MLLLERDPLVMAAEPPRENSIGDCPPGGLPLHAPRRVTLMLWVAVVALTHFDRGAATVVAMDIVANWEEGAVIRHSFGYAVALLAWHSIGLALGGVLAGAAFQAASPKAVVVLALLANAAALCTLSLQVRAGLLLVSALRLASGIAASFPLVYLPLWVDEFAPSRAHGQWMAIVQLGTPVGQFFGVLTAAIATVASRGAGGLDWRIALLLQALLLVLVSLRVILVPATQVDVAHISTLRARLDSITLYQTDGSLTGYVHGLWREIRDMFIGASRNPLTAWLSASLCLLHSTGAGLALWGGPFLATAEGAPPPIAALLVASVALLTAPAAGTYAGAVLCDRLNGFKAGHHAAALRVACGFIAVSASAGPVSSSASSFVARLAAVVIWLFGAGGFLPISVGVLMTAMPSYLRSFSSTSSLIVFHLVGYALVPGAIAMVMSCFTRQSEGLAFGVGFSLWVTAPAAGLLLLAYAREPRCAAPGGLSGVDDLTFSEITYELSRRRMSTAPL